MFRLFKSHRCFKGINSVLPGCCVKKKNVAKPVRDFIQNEIKLGGYHVRIRAIRYMVVSVSIHMQFTITVTDKVWQIIIEERK